jgi:hypothetical protein
MFFDVLE